MNAWTLCAMAGVAVRPVPMAHTGSYAMTIFPRSSSSVDTSRSAPWSCVAQTSLTSPASYCALLSPTQITGASPASRIARVLSPTSTSVSWNNSLRSECPTSAKSHPTLTACASDISPVNAPDGSCETFCAPSFTLLPARTAATAGRNGAGGHTRTSHPRVADPPCARSAAATSAARDSASLSVFGFIFQLPAMSGVRARGWRFEGRSVSRLAIVAASTARATTVVVVFALLSSRRTPRRLE
mmetsp:Transcript_7061/g.25974  ORF Transcript_7061/g.25974 Transcript_7061/m.25974 type:complete len:242 (-) Transcript_7061:200-925(-)